MSYSRRTVVDGSTVMNADLYNNLQDGIDECKEEILNSKIKLGDVSGAIATSSQKTILLKWSDPTDVVVGSSVVSEWAGTKVIRKAGSAPTDENDGVEVVDNTTRNQYSSSAFVDNDEDLEYGVTYYYRFFPYNTEDIITKGSAVNSTPVAYRIMTVNIDLTNSNPATWATYADDAVGMTAGDSAWDDFFGVYECMLKDGVEGVKLNPNNLAKDVDGNNVDITSGNAGDVMTKFSKVLGWKVTKSNNVVSISLTDADNKSGYSYKAFYYKGQKCKSFYRGCFKGFEQNSKLWSLSGKIITASKTIGAFRTLAQTKGTGYEQSTYYAMQLLQIMDLLKYKGANSQIAIGRGFVDGNSAATTTGGTIAKGRDWGETTGKQQMCFLNQEDFYGNVWEWIDGLTTDSGRNYRVCDPTTSTAFNDGGTGYSRVGGGWSSNQGGYISSVIGSNDAPLTADGFSGSETTYLCDYAHATDSRVTSFGGDWSDASFAGAFYVHVYNAASYSYANIGSRLMFFEVESAA